MGRQPDSGVAGCETPQHQVHLAAFYMGLYPVTNAQYAAFLEACKQQPAPKKGGWSMRRPAADRLHYPVTAVSWFDAEAYCRWLSQSSGFHYRLPSEAEWEKAAGGLDGRTYPWGCQWDPSCCGLGQTTAAADDLAEGVGPFGCFHMTGNVQEWTATRWGSDPVQSDFPYPYRAEDGRESLEAGFHIHRGGSYRDSPERLGCRIRGWSNPAGKFLWRGFRILREA